MKKQDYTLSLTTRIEERFNNADQIEAQMQAAQDAQERELLRLEARKHRTHANYDSLLANMSDKAVALASKFKALDMIANHKNAYERAKIVALFEALAHNDASLLMIDFQKDIKSARMTRDYQMYAFLTRAVKLNDAKAINNNDETLRRHSLKLKTKFEMQDALSDARHHALHDELYHDTATQARQCVRVLSKLNVLEKRDTSFAFTDSKLTDMIKELFA